MILAECLESGNGNDKHPHMTDRNEKYFLNLWDRPSHITRHLLGVCVTCTEDDDERQREGSQERPEELHHRQKGFWPKN